MDQTTSMEIGELAGALAKAQGKITGALKDSANPFFKSKYADLASVWDACRDHLAANGLAVIQTTAENENGVTVITTLAHSSGQWIRGTLTMTPTKNDPQGIGSCISYARRYALSAIVGIAQVDDDANAASGKAMVHDPMDRENLKVNESHKTYADAFAEALASSPDAVKQVEQDMKEETDIDGRKWDDSDYRAVWSLMDSKTRAAVKRALAMKVAA